MDLVTDIRKVDKKDDMVYLVGHISVATGFVDGKMTNWIEMTEENAVKLVHLLEGLLLIER